MSLKNLSVANKTPNHLKNNLINKRINQIYKKFEKSFEPKTNFIVGVSGGADSLALAFLTKLYSYRNKISAKYFIVDHKLRKESSSESAKVKRILKSININSEILIWKGKKPQKNIQSIARKKRYDLLFSKCKQLKINNIVLGHHIDDLLENFFLRMIRGSGLKGLVSLGKKTQIKKISLLRPLLNFNKSDLLFISKNVFNFYVDDPSNYDVKFSRIKVRNLINKFQEIGLDKKKLLLTLENLKKSNETIMFYTERNKKINSFMNFKKKELILGDNFFDNSYEVVFRSLTDLIQIIGKKYNSVRGKKIDNLLEKINNKTLVKETLGGCVIKRVNQTVILSKEY